MNQPAQTSSSAFNSEAKIMLPESETLTLSYLTGQITLQQYETIMETRQFENELILNNQNSSDNLNNAILPFNLANEVQISSLDPAQTIRNNDEAIDLTLLKPLKNRKRTSNSTSSNTNKFSENHIENANGDFFYDLKNLVSSTEHDIEDEYNKRSVIISNELDAFDDTSNWNDFDIETLNFDKFIKDNQKQNAPQQSIDSDKKKDFHSVQSNENKSSNGLFYNKRKRDNVVDVNDLSELKAKRKRNKVLPIEIQGLMGEANLNYARGETNKAIDICLEVIKYAPKASEPFQLLSLLYSEMGQSDKALRVGLIAAQLNKDPDEWIQLIQQAIIEGDAELVLFCYNNAIQCNPKNSQLHIDRIRLLEEKKDTRRLILSKLMLLKYVDVNTEFEIYDKYFNQVMSELSNENDRSKKIYVLKNDMKKFQDNFQLSRLKLLIELMIEQKSFKESIMIMMSQCQIAIKSNLNSQIRLNSFESFKHLNNLEFDIPDSCKNYLRALFIVCLINLDYNNEESLILPLYNGNDIETNANEFKVIANTYYSTKKYSKAKIYFHLLLTNVREFLVQMDIWLKYGNCCSNLGDMEDAINAFRNAVNLDSSNCEAALSLVNILKKNSLLFDEAANVINNTLDQKKSKYLTIEILNLKLNQCFIQYEKNDYEKFISNARNLLFSNILFVLEQKNINDLIRVDSKVQKAIVFHQLLEENNYEMQFYYNKLNSEIQNYIFEIYLKLCKCLVKLKRYDELLTYSVGATVLPLVYERMDWNKSINYTCLIACMLKNDGKNAFNVLKEFIIEFKNSNKLWSFVSIVISLFPSLNQQKFFIRMSAKFMDHLPLCLINAHFAIMSGTYRYALVEYMNCFKQNPFDPFINLIISITYCHISSQKFNTKRHLLVSQSLVFLRRYIKFRGICQETYYNVARIMHQLSLFDLATHYYTKCLETPCFFPEQEEVYNLKRFAAYNLVLIFKHTGSFTLARQIMKDYLTV